MFLLKIILSCTLSTTCINGNPHCVVWTKAMQAKKFVKWLCAHFDEGVNQWLIEGGRGLCVVEELFSCRNGQPQQQPRGSIDFVIHSDNQIRFYVINTHTDTHTEYPQRLRAHTQCETMPKYEFNLESNNIALECVAVGIVQICCAYSAGSAIF